MSNSKHIADLAPEPTDLEFIPDDDRLIPATELCRLAGQVTLMTLWRWRRDGLLPEPVVIRRRNYWWKRRALARLAGRG